jgi:hypothetical protein
MSHDQIPWSYAPIEEELSQLAIHVKINQTYSDVPAISMYEL